MEDLYSTPRTTNLLVSASRSFDVVRAKLDFFVLPTVHESTTYANRVIQPCSMAPQVIESYSCALYSGGLPLHGRLSVTADTASFSGWRNTKVMLHWVLFHPHQAGRPRAG